MDPKTPSRPAGWLRRWWPGGRSSSQDDSPAVCLADDIQAIAERLQVVAGVNVDRVVTIDYLESLEQNAREQVLRLERASSSVQQIAAFAQQTAASAHAIAGRASADAQHAEANQHAIENALAIIQELAQL